MFLFARTYESLFLFGARLDNGRRNVGQFVLKKNEKGPVLSSRFKITVTLPAFFVGRTASCPLRDEQVRVRYFATAGGVAVVSI